MMIFVFPEAESEFSNFIISRKPPSDSQDSSNTNHRFIIGKTFYIHLYKNKGSFVFTVKAVLVLT